jgi:hypothetical protein
VRRRRRVRGVCLLHAEVVLALAGRELAVVMRTHGFLLERRPCDVCLQRHQLERWLKGELQPAPNAEVEQDATEVEAEDITLASRSPS